MYVCMYVCMYIYIYREREIYIYIYIVGMNLSKAFIAPAALGPAAGA